MIKPENSREGSCKRRLHFGRHHAVELSSRRVENIASLDDASPERTWLRNQQDSQCRPLSQQYDAAEFGEHLLRSPTHDGGVRCARAEETMGRLGQLTSSSSMMAANGGPQRPCTQLIAALSSSRRSLERLCSPAGSAQADVLPLCSPPAATVAALPPAPRKRSAEAAGLGQLAKDRPRAARALQGLTPANLSELQHVRAWLTLLEAR